MRYLNWDILMFPDDSKIPVPEFDVKCHVLPAEQVPTQKLINAAGNDHLSSVVQVPTLTCFIPSMDAGHPFRISVHSWDAPKMSPLLASLNLPLERVAFEIRLLIDGQLKSQKVIRLRKLWPEVINTTETIWTEYPQLLLFPSFHPEILQQAHWDASDGMGRIKLFISEGLSQVDGRGEVINFSKLRDIVAFSFQHAPREILEKTQIAWPSAAMFQKAAISLQQSDASAHGHSPTRAGKPKVGRNIWKPILDQAEEWSMKPQRSEDDPFFGPSQSSMMKPSRKVPSDFSMADFPTARNQSEMSDVKIQQPDFQQQVNRAAIDEIVRALTPRKRAALLNALSPTDLLSTSSNRSKTLPHNRIASVRGFNPATRPRPPAGSLRRSSNESRRSASGNSTIMSWDETPMLSDSWSNSKNNDFPGLLPSIPTSTHSNGSSESTRRRKRSPSQPLLPQAGDAFARAIEEMSTSPCKKSPTPAKRARVEVAAEANNENGTTIS